MIQTKPKVVDTACRWVKPITISIEEAELIKNGTISPETARQILAHNKKVARKCRIIKKQ